MFNFTVTVQERKNGSIYIGLIDLRGSVDDSTPSEKRVAETIKQAARMARVQRTRPTKNKSGEANYLDTVRAAQGMFSDLEWALGLANMTTGGPGEE